MAQMLISLLLDLDYTSSFTANNFTNICWFISTNASEHKFKVVEERQSNSYIARNTLLSSRPNAYVVFVDIGQNT